MNWKLKDFDRLANDWQGTATQEVWQICRLLEDHATAGLSQPIYDVRRRIKRIRALLRLTADHLGDHFRRKQNSAWRAIGHALAPLRDTEVRLATLQNRARTCPGLISVATISAIARQLARKPGGQSALTTKSRKLLQEKLQSTLAGIEPLPLAHLKKKELRAGLKRAQLLHEKTHHQARRSSSDDHLHMWRKRAKSLAHQMELVTGSIFRREDKKIRLLLKIGKQLGDDHDLAILQMAMREAGPATLRKLERPLRARRSKLQKAAFAAFKKIR